MKTEQKSKTISWRRLAYPKYKTLRPWHQIYAWSGQSRGAVIIIWQLSSWKSPTHFTCRRVCIKCATCRILMDEFRLRYSIFVFLPLPPPKGATRRLAFSKYPLFVALLISHYEQNDCRSKQCYAFKARLLWNRSAQPSVYNLSKYWR